MELVWRLMKTKMKRRCISESRKLGFVRVLKYEQQVNSRKVWLGSPLKFFVNLLTRWLLFQSKESLFWRYFRQKFRYIFFFMRWNHFKAVHQNFYLSAIQWCVTSNNFLLNLLHCNSKDCCIPTVNCFEIVAFFEVLLSGVVSFLTR